MKLLVNNEITMKFVRKNLTDKKIEWKIKYKGATEYKKQDMCLTM